MGLPLDVNRAVFVLLCPASLLANHFTHRRLVSFECYNLGFGKNIRIWGIFSPFFFTSWTNKKRSSRTFGRTLGLKTKSFNPAWQRSSNPWPSQAATTNHPLLILSMETMLDSNKIRIHKTHCKCCGPSTFITQSR